VAHGLSRRLDRLAAIGNAVVPAVAAIALQRVLYLASFT
jgi:DNA (cytosine-5)-methyltransferase 1